MIFITACSPTTEMETKEEFFQDKALEAAVLKELTSKDVNAEEDDFASIESLEVSEAGITDLEGIEKLTSLNYLDLTGNDIDDLSPLLSLENLSEVDLGDVYFTGDKEAPMWSVLEKLEKNRVEVHTNARLSFEEHVGPSEGVFYKVKKDSQTVYLLGSIHLGDQSLYPLNEQINTAFEEADHLAVEIDIGDLDEMEVSQTIMQQGMYQDGKVLSEVVEEDVFNDALEQLSALGMNEEIVDQFQPWFVTMLLSEVALQETALNAEFGIDKHFIDRAKDKSLPIISLESVESQIASMSSAPEEEQIESLEYTIESIDNFEEELIQLMRVWRAGNSDVFAQLREMNQGSDQLAMDERDLLMSSKIEEFLNADNGDTYFVVVGSLHLAGENSITDLLKTRGYSVEPPGEF
jgi:uncharacterized protein YbaP (TraB family)